MTIANVNIKKVLFRRGNTIQNDNYVGVFGEVSVDTQANTLRVHNGVTAGGTRLATYAELTDIAVGNIDLTGYTTTAQITAANTEIGKLRANITAANAAIVSNYNFLLSNAGVAHTEINGLRADITAANVAWTANAATQATAINSINANLGSFQTYANATFTGGGGGSNYSNTNVAAYLTGSITAGNIVPNANVTYTLGNLTHWWKELYVGSNTIFIAGVPLSIDSDDNLLINGNIVQGGNVDAVNSNVAVIDANIGAYQRWANTNAAVQTTSINTTNANIGAYQIWANANAATQTTSINTTNANIGAYQIWANANAAAQTTVINTINANVAAANAAIESVTTAWTANAGVQATDINALRGNVTAANAAIESVTTAWTANAGAQATEINSLRANVTASNAAIATLQTQVYNDTNTAAYLAGAVTAGNVTTGNLTVEYNAVVLGNLRVAGTQTTVNASTLNITDLWVTVADGATQASDAHGAGLRVDGALANIAYSSVSDSFEFNKQIVVGNVKFSDTTRLSGNTITLPNTQGFNWYFNDPMIGNDTVTLYMNGLTTGYDSWALTTGNGTNSWLLDSSTQEFSLFNGGVDGGKLVFGTAANAGVRSSIDDIELKSSVGNVFIRANANPWTFSENGNLILPTRMNFMSSPAISGTGIIFGDGSYQYKAYSGVPDNILVNGLHTATLDSTGNLNVPGDILPALDNTHDLGSATQRFRHLYVGPGTVYVGNAAIKTTATGNLILPGLTRAIASTAYAEEVDEEDDQTQTFTTVPTVIDNAQYSDLSGRVTGLSFTPAEYSVNQLDGEGYIDGISITSPGSGYSDQVSDLAEQDMWATEVANPFASFVANDWVQIPFRVRSRAGESEYNFNTSGTDTGFITFNDDQIGSTSNVVNIVGGDYAQLQSNDNYVWVDSTGAFIQLGNRTFEFDNNDNSPRLKLPAGGDIVDSTGASVLGGGTANLGNLEINGSVIGTDGSTDVDSYIAFTAYSSNDVEDPDIMALGTNNGKDVYITTDGGQTNFKFYSNSGLGFPDGTVQTTAYTGGGGNVSLPGLATSGTGTSDVAGNQVYALSINTESESDDEIALKVYAGGNNAGPAIAIGQDIGGSHRANVVAIGNFDVGYNSLPGGVYIGYGAGFNDTEQPQGLHSIAIGSKAAWNFATNNSITLNATGNQLNPDESGLFIKPIRAEEYDDVILYYNPDSGEVTYANNAGVSALVTVGNTASGTEGALWYNTEDGRTYVYALDTWIDASPAVVPGNMVGYDLDGNITLRDDASINYANGVSIINSVYGDSQVASFLSDYTGNIAKIGSAPLNITAASVRLNSDNETWSFDNNGVITFPDGTRQNTAAADLGNFAGNIVKPGAGDGYEFSANVADITVINGGVFVQLDQALFGGPTEGLITIAGVTGMTEINGTWGYQAVEYRDIQLYTTYPIDTVVTGEGWGAYTSGGTAVSFGANPLVISADSITLRTVNNNNYLFDNYGIRFPDDTVQTTAYTGSGGNVDLSNYTSGNVFINRENTGLIVDAAGDKRVGFMKYFGIESSFVHANGPTKSVPFRIGRVAADDITRANNSVFTTEVFISNIGKVGINTTSPTEQLDVSGNVGISGALLIGANTTISNDGAEFRLWATDTDITVYRNGQDGYGVKAGNIEVYTDNGLRTLTNSNGFELTTGNLVIPTDGGILYANGVNILSSVPSTGNITFDDSDIIGTGSNVTITANNTDYTFYSNGTVKTDDTLTIQVPSGIPTGVANWDGQGGWNQGFYGDLATTGGTGTGLTVDVAAGGGGYINIEAITIQNPGSGYTDGDVITIENENNLTGTFTLVVVPKNWNFGANGVLTTPGSVTMAAGGRFITNGNTGITASHWYNYPNTTTNWFARFYSDESANLKARLGLENLSDITIETTSDVDGLDNAGPDHKWSFGANGNLTLPAGSTIGERYGSGSGVYLSGGDVNGVGLASQFANTWIQTIETGFFIGTSFNTGTQKQWNFNGDGSTEFPDLMPVSITGNLTTGNVDTTGTANVANLIISGTAPGSPLGSAGDTAGMIRVDSNYIYYCTSTFVPASWTVGWGGATSNTLFLTQGDYPTPQVGWIVDQGGNGPWTIDTISDTGYGSWQITWVGIPYGSPTGGTATLTNPNPSTIWKTVPLNIVANAYVAIGTGAGATSQGLGSVAVGLNAGNDTQGYYAVAVGIGAGRNTQADSTVAIGGEAGGDSQGVNSVAIGYRAGRTSQAARTIILNATGANLNASTTDTLTVAPIRNTTGNVGVLQYNDGTKEVSYSNTLGGNLTVTGNITQQSAYYETYANVTNSGGNLTCNFVNGSTFYATLTANVTVNFANVVATAGRVTGATLIVDQGATPYGVSNIQINGGAVQSVRWAGGVGINTGTASNTDIMSFSLISLDGTSWRILGQVSNYA